MFNPLNLGVFTLLFHVGEVYFFSTSGLCVCVFDLGKSSLYQQDIYRLPRGHIGYIRGYYPSVTRSGIDSGFLSIYSLS